MFDTLDMRFLSVLMFLLGGCASAQFEPVHGGDPFTGTWTFQTDWYDTADGRRTLGGGAEIRRGRLEYRAEITTHEVTADGKVFWARQTCRSRLLSRRAELDALTLRCHRFQGSVAYSGSPGYGGDTFVLRRHSRDELAGEVTSGEDVQIRFRRVLAELMQPSETPAQ